MLFASPGYGVFLLAVVAAFWLLRAERLLRALLLVGASYAFYFYGTWQAALDEPVPVAPALWALGCVALILVGSTIDFVVGRALGAVEAPVARNALLFVSLAYYLTVLALFKYWNFAADAVAAIAARATHGPVNAPHLRLVLPFGLSFFTFETMSYTIDVWRRQIRPSTRYLDYLLFVCFFPHLVAGPIVRPAQMLPQLAAPPRADALAQARGLFRIASGLVKKIAIGDALARGVVDRVFATPERFTALEVAIAVYAYAAQIYADFSGYTDVAIGSAALFGYALPENFAAPYLAHSLQDFWRRWHISLSTWLRDYLYKPLGGSRRGRARTYVNLMITMVLGGLWHGASWTFVVWGALHGAALAVTRAWQRARALGGERDGTTRSTGASWEGASPSAGRQAAALLGRGVAVLATFHFVCFAWIFFRAPTLAHAELMLARLAGGGAGLDHIGPRVLVVLAAAAFLHLVPADWKRRLREAFARTPSVVQGAVLAAVAMALHLVAGARPEPFVYGQF